MKNCFKVLVFLLACSQSFALELRQISNEDYDNLIQSPRTDPKCVRLLRRKKLQDQVYYKAVKVQKTYEALEGVKKAQVSPTTAKRITELRKKSAESVARLQEKLIRQGCPLQF